MNKPLPTHLHAAYAWTAAAGELNELRDLRGDALTVYCSESAENCYDLHSGDVTADDLLLLHDWLVRR